MKSRAEAAEPRWSALASRLLWAASLTACVSAWGAAKPPQPDDAWKQVPGILERIVPPVFPGRVFEVTRFGARPDAETPATRAFAEAIAACARAGGGRVLVPAGKYFTGPIHLTSNVELHLSDGAELVFSDNPEDYLPPVLVRVGGIDLYNYSPLIYARDATNIAVTGTGRLNGNAKKWWDWKSRETRTKFEMGARGVPVEQRVFGTPEAAIRPSFLTLVGCRNILLEGFTIGSGPNWTIHPVYCENVTVRRVSVITDGPNNDGIDPDSCRDVLIEHCVFDTGDDCVVLKSGYNEDGWRVGRPTENVIMRHCQSRRGHGGLVIGSEMSGGVRNVFVHDCEFVGTDRAIRIKSRADRGGVVERVYARNLKTKDLVGEVVILNMDYSADRNEVARPRPPVFRDMHFESFTGEGSPTAILIQGLEASPIERIRFSAMKLTSKRGVVVNQARGLVFEDVQIVSERAPAYALTNVSDVVIRGARVVAGQEPFLSLEGAISGVRLESCDLPREGEPVRRGKGVPATAVEVK